MESRPKEAIAVESWPYVGGMPPFLDDRVREATRVQVRYWRLEAKPRELFADVYFGKGATGPPGHVHGGAMAALLDEVMALNHFVAGVPAVAASLSTQFEHMLPVESAAVAHAWIAQMEGRRILAAAVLAESLADNAVVYSRAEAAYVELDEKRAANLKSLGYEG